MVSSDSQPPGLENLPPVTGEQYAWGVAEAEYDSGPLIIRYNALAGEWIGHPELPIKLSFVVPLNQPDDGGLPHPDENTEIDVIEDRILQEIAARTLGIHVLVLTTGMMKEFVFHIPRGVDIKAIHDAVRTAVTTHEVQCEAAEEPDWESYLAFTPDDETGFGDEAGFDDETGFEEE